MFKRKFLRLGFSGEIGSEEMKGSAAILHDTISVVDESSGWYLTIGGGAACQGTSDGKRCAQLPLIAVTSLKLPVRAGAI